MRSLRFVHLAGDGTHLVLETADGGEQFVLPNDAAVRDSLRSDTRPPALERSGRAPAHAAAEPTGGAPAAHTAPAAAHDISPREIQVRVRAGESPEELADALGVPVERIARFAAPVVDERLRIADEARRARAHRSTAEAQLVVFGEAVDERFAAHGIVPTEVTWGSFRRDDGEWIVVADWLGGEGRHEAQWAFHRSSRSVTPLDDTATDLLSDRPIRPVAPPPSVDHLALSEAPTLGAGVVSFPPMPDAMTAPLPTFEQVFDQEAAGGADLEFDAPPLPLGITDPSMRPAAAGGFRLSSVGPAGKHDESEDDRAARVRVPSWDDILLGVRRKQD